jgi:phosphate transport system permease protein
MHFGVAAVLYGTVITTFIAVIIALPIGIAISSIIVYYLRGWFKECVIICARSLSFIPSVIYGLFGLFYVVPIVAKLSEFLNKYFSFIPIFSTSNNIFGRSFLCVGIILAIMIVSIIVSSLLESFERIKKSYAQSLLSLGYTREQMLYSVLLKVSFKSISNSFIVATNRAVGETTAVSMCIGATYIVSYKILDTGGSTIASNIASNILEANKLGKSALTLSGLILYIVALVVFFAVNFFVRKHSKYYEL